MYPVHPIHMTRLTYTKDQVDQIEKLLLEFPRESIKDVLFLIERIHEANGKHWENVQNSKDSLTVIQ